MAASTWTIDTGEWIYIDHTGVQHTVTNAQTLSMTVVDGGTSLVTYSIPVAQSVTTTDGYNINIQSNTDNANVNRDIGTLTDAGQGSDFYGIRGEFVMDIDTGANIPQLWSIAKINPSNADFNAAGTITMTLEDQFGNQMVMPATGSGITVGQAS